MDTGAINDPLISFLLTTPYAYIVTYLLAARAVCSELEAWLPQAAPASRFFILRKIISFVAGNYGNAAPAGSVGLLEGIVIRVLEAKGLTTVPIAKDSDIKVAPVAQPNAGPETPPATAVTSPAANKVPWARPSTP